MASEAVDLQSANLVYDQRAQAALASISGAAAQVAPPPSSTGFATAAVGDVAQLSGASKLANQQSQYSQVGAVLRYSNQALGEIQARLGVMHDALEGIVKKLYPPYPINSPERIALLNKVTSLRKQIDALTYPPKDQWQGQLIGDPAKLPGAGDIKLPGSPSDGAATVIKAVPAYAGPGGLDLPNLSPQASDAAVAAGLARVEDAQRYVKDARASLYQETAKLFGQTGETQAVNSGQDGRTQLANTSQGILNSDSARTSVEALL